MVPCASLWRRKSKIKQNEVERLTDTSDHESLENEKIMKKQCDPQCESRTETESSQPPGQEAAKQVRANHPIRMECKIVAMERDGKIVEEHTYYFDFQTDTRLYPYLNLSHIGTKVLGNFTAEDISRVATSWLSQQSLHIQLPLILLQQDIEQKEDTNQDVKEEQKSLNMESEVHLTRNTRKAKLNNAKSSQNNKTQGTIFALDGTPISLLQQSGDDARQDKIIHSHQTSASVIAMNDSTGGSPN